MWRKRSKYPDKKLRLKREAEKRGCGDWQKWRKKKKQCKFWIYS